MRQTLTTGPLLLICSLAACTEQGQAAPRQVRIADSSAGTVALGIENRPYRVTPAGQTGAFAGAITARPQPLTNSGVMPPRDARLCGDTVSGNGSNGDSPVNVLVWIDGIATGKAFPEVRRETLTVQSCRFRPRLLAVTTGTTINVLSLDRAAMTSRFFRENGGVPVEEIRTVDAGQVVPSEKIAGKAGIVEVRRKEHPWARGYIAVFDHPYFAVTDAQGRFTIDGLPPGTYTARIWYEGLSDPVEQRVVIAPGGTSRLEMEIGGGTRD